ncbi:MORN repeat protein [Aequorivita sublithincola DSM 14238]|uniref:MORN repeat protein n=1 Tax=Aequorivita sublithincola (strain DSM 14238 / LMG 21431 / ACAM 643 / 9-3) TaxID=746697 RepID=I3YYD7_AEQSU|nr:MORN repeat protein [Aequorivita sublithincola]AFL82005.1 MORN repeat protein [Aequorivita sublithincola DSM 14238]
MRNVLILICLFIGAASTSQIREYNPDNIYKKDGEKNSQGVPIGEWEYYGAFSDDRPAQYFNYDTRISRVYFIQDIASGKPLILQEKGKLNEDFEKTGTWTFYHNSREGEIIAKKGDYINGLENGEWKEFYPNGTLQSTSYWIKGTPVGKWESYFPDGSLRSIKNYEKGVSVGEWQEYYEDGTIKEITNYTEGIRNGIFTETQKFDDVILVKVGMYVNGFPDGEIITYYVQDGNKYVYERVLIRNKKITGAIKRYNAEGKVIGLISYNDDNDITEMKEYFDDGTLRRFSTALPDAGIESVWEISEYYPNGNLKMKFIEKDSKYHNIVSAKDPNGNSLDYGTLKDGNGTLYQYSDEGKISSITTLKYGIPNGPYTEFGTITFNDNTYQYKKTGTFTKEGKVGDFITTVEKDGKNITIQTATYYQNIAIDQKNYNIDGMLQEELHIDTSTGIKEEIVYYPSGSIKTKLQFQYPDVLLNVLICKDPNGKNLDYGSIKDGSGVYKEYDMSGKLVTTYTFKEGKVVSQK